MNIIIESLFVDDRTYVLTTSTIMSGTYGDDCTTPPVTMATQLVTEAPVTTAAPTTQVPITTALGTYVPYVLGPLVPGFYTPTGLTQQGAKALQVYMLPNPFLMYPLMLLMATGQLTQWGHFHLESTAETYLLTEEPHRDSQWDPQGHIAYQTLHGDAGGETSSVWLELWQGGMRTPPKEQVIVEDDNKEDEDDQWTNRLTNLERGQHNIQRNLEEVMLTIPKIVI
ncbi:UNVERIFIED_CONTAM: hypothetical protein K2H54_066023 [Gekko kuhli]